MKSNNFTLKRIENKYFKKLLFIFESDPVFDYLSENISIIDTKLSSDFHHLTIYYQLISNKQGFKEYLNKQIPIIKKTLSKSLSLRKIPNIYFLEDKSFENGQLIETLVKKNKN